MSETVRTIAVLSARVGHASELAELLRGMVSASRAEPGNLRYDLWRDAEAPGRFVIDEIYRDASALASHRATPHFQDYRSRIEELAERTVVVLERENVVSESP